MSVSLMRLLPIAAFSATAGALAVLALVIRNGEKALSPVMSEPPKVKPSAEIDMDEIARRVERSLEVKRLRQLAETQRAAAEDTVEPDQPASTVPGPKRPRPSVAALSQTVWQEEARDDAWAGPIEAKFMQEANAGPHRVEVERLACGTSRCAVSLKADSDSFVQSISSWFGDGKTVFEYKPTKEGIEYYAVHLRDGFDLDGNPL